MTALENSCICGGFRFPPCLRPFVFVGTWHLLLTDPEFVEVTWSVIPAYTQSHDKILHFCAVFLWTQTVVRLWWAPVPETENILYKETFLILRRSPAIVKMHWTSWWMCPVLCWLHDATDHTVTEAGEIHTVSSAESRPPTSTSPPSLCRSVRSRRAYRSVLWIPCWQREAVINTVDDWISPGTVPSVVLFVTDTDLLLIAVDGDQVCTSRPAVVSTLLPVFLLWRNVVGAAAPLGLQTCVKEKTGSRGFTGKQKAAVCNDSEADSDDYLVVSEEHLARWSRLPDLLRADLCLWSHCCNCSVIGRTPFPT